jgi:phosphatidylserine decarboxylase
VDIWLPGPYLLRSPIEGSVVDRWDRWHDPAGRARRPGRAICIRTDEGDEVLLAYAPRLPVPLRLRAAVGERVGHGQPLGLLPFGGRAAVLFSGHGRALVAPGDRVVAGVDPVAELLHD